MSGPDSKAALQPLGMLPEEWQSELLSMGQPAFRARQVIEWVFAKRATSVEQMSSLPKSLREALAARLQLRSMRLTQATGSADETRKLLLRLHDGRLVECVLIPASPDLYGQRADRLTLCVSSQVGCAMDCRFCASGLAGFTRNLSAAEIVEQVLQAEQVAGQRVDNLVFMGMGEPLANLSALIKALTILNAPWGMGIGARHMTVSTSGLVPQIRQLAKSAVPVRLAISLHGASDEVRSTIMPINRKYPIHQLMESLEEWHRLRSQRITLEYILIDQVNDGLDQARLLVPMARRLDARVNLIPYNLVEGLPWKRPSETRQRTFAKVLEEAGVRVTLRREKGHDIAAACGQLRLKQETAEGIVDGLSVVQRRAAASAAASNLGSEVTS
jgi:23S rRNA (adenine2503-C2)-methyltransferase